MADVETFKKEVKRDLEAGRTAFDGKYAHELDELMGLSREDIDAITPDATDLHEYDRLITVVKKASQHNVSQAQLVANIKALGKVAVAIATKSAGLAALLK